MYSIWFLALAMLVDRTKVLSPGVFLPSPYPKNTSESVGPESSDGLAGCLWLKASHEVAGKL